MPARTRRRHIGSLRKPLHALAGRLSTDAARFVALCMFIAIVFATGGGSRADILSLVVLRPVALLMGAYALLVARPGDFRAVAWPLGLMACLLAIVGLQLVPLPPGLWSGLPYRQLYVEIASSAGIPLGYRPLTLSPARTLNALFSLSIPLSAILLAAVQSDRYRAKLPAVLLVACGASALLAIGQMAGPDNGVLYLYRVTNNGFPVGLLANRNHQALLMVVLLVLMADFHLRAQRSGTLGTLSNVGIALAALVVFALILVAGSRAGLLLAVLVIPVIGWMHLQARRHSPGNFPWKINRAWWAAIAGAFVAVVAIAIVFSRAASIERLWSSDALADSRVERLPILLEMLRDHWLLGIGFGAFEGAFKRYETVESLTPFIFNQAHNDWIQFPMEGGLPAAVLMMVVFVWLVSRAYQAFRSGAGFHRQTTSAVILLLIALGSLVDYPLRTPIFMLIGAVAFTQLARRKGGEKFA